MKTYADTIAPPLDNPTGRHRLQHLRRFYSLLSVLEGANRDVFLSNCSGRMNWPKRGVYFFREHGETRTDAGNGLRIVRVGTHALTATSNTTLWQRLSQHKGISKTGGGNHRGSIFRLLVGTALKRKNAYSCDSWGMGSSADATTRKLEEPVEIHVSKIIRNMPLLWLAVQDNPGPGSTRGYIERHSIALLSNFGKTAIDPASPHWLGSYCDREKVSQSGLWNQRHTEEDYDPAFLDELERLIEMMQVSL